MNSTSIWNKVDDNSTPIKKYSHQKSTNNFSKQKRDDTYSREKEISLSVHKHFKDVDCDSRISNIEKINLKIKKILDSGSELKDQGFKFKNIQKENISVTPKKNDKYGGIGDRIDLKLNLSFIEKEN